MKEIPEIKAAISAFQKETVFSQLRRRYEKDFDLYRMKPYDAGKGYYSHTTNSARLLANQVIGRIAESKLFIQIAVETLRDEDKDIANNVERFLYGILTLVDEDNLYRDNPALIEQMAWHAAIRGGFAVKPYLYKNDKGETKISIAVWDLYNTSYGSIGDGLSWGALSRRATKAEILQEYDKKIPNEDAEVIDFCNETDSGVIVNNEWAVELHPHNMDRCPITILRTGSMPTIWQERYTNTDLHRGESVFANNREVIPMINKVLSDYATIVRRGVKVPLGYWSAGGKKTIDEDIYQVDKAATIALDSSANERIEPLLKPSMPADAGVLLQLLSGEEQRGGVSHLAQGELGFRLSGFAVNQITAYLDEIIAPFRDCVERGLRVACLSILKQYAVGGWNPIAVRGRTSQNHAFGMAQPEFINPQQIAGNWHPEIKLLPLLPKDEAQNFSLAQLAKQNELLSLETIQEHYLGVDDTQLERAKMSAEWSSNLIINKLYDAYMALVERGDTMRAQNVLTELQRVLMAQGGAVPPPRPGQSSVGRLQQMGMGMPGTGMPPSETGVPTSVMPSEQMGGIPGGAGNAIGAPGGGP